MEPTVPSTDAIGAQLERILASSAFDGAQRAKTLLRFLVERTLAGESDALKEYTLGAEALGRGASFDPRIDPIVRAEASRLRNRLERYYGAEGRADPVVITLPKGTYVPQFQPRVGEPDDRTVPASADRVWPRWSKPSWVVLVSLGIAIGAASIAVWMATRPDASGESNVMQFDVELKSAGVLGSVVGTDAIISPDGTRIVFVSRDSAGVAHLNARRVDQPVAFELPGTDGARNPFFSPDGAWIGFWASAKLQKIAVDGGRAIVLCPAVDLLGASWGHDGTIVAALSFGKLWRISSASGQSSVLADLTSEGSGPSWPQLLPDGKHVLFTAVGNQGANAANIESLSLVDGRRTVLIRGGTFGRYLSNGYLAYVNQGTVFALPFDVGRMEASAATPTPVLDGVAYSSTFGFAQFDVSQTGTLIYRKSTGRGQLVAAWIDRTGRVSELPMRPNEYAFPRLSPDGRRVAIVATEGGHTALQLHDRQSHGMLRLDSEPGEYSPTWTPDARWLVLGGRKGLYWLNPDATQPARILRAGSAIQVPWSFSPDGKRLAFHQVSPVTGFDLWTVPVSITSGGITAGEPEPFLQTTAVETYPSFSPDGRWLAYASGAFGKWEVYVRRFPPDGTSEIQVSEGGGRIARWLRNGRELLYRTDDQRLMVVSYTVKNDVFTVAKPYAWSSTLLADTGVISNFDVDVDDQHILALLPAPLAGDRQSPNHATVVLNFADELRRKVSGGIESVPSRR